MGWPKRKYGFIVTDGRGRPLRLSDNGVFYTAGFGDVFTDRKMADRVVAFERGIYLGLIEHSDTGPENYALRRAGQPHTAGTKCTWAQYAQNVRVIRIAFPETNREITWEMVKEATRRD